MTPPLFDVYLSYTTADTRFAQKLERYLKHLHREFSVFKSLQSDLFAKHIRPVRVFRDESDMGSRDRKRPGERQDYVTGQEIDPIKLTLLSYLEQSSKLLVVCSRSTPNSAYVAWELDWFLSHGREDDVYFAVIEGNSPSETPELYFPKLAILQGLHRKRWFDFRGHKGQLARGWSSVRDPEEARLNLAACALDVSVEVIRPTWVLVEREREKRRYRILAVIVGIIATLAVALLFYYLRAETARRQAEQLVDFMVFDLQQKLDPIGRLDILDDVNRRVNEYYESAGRKEGEYQSHRLCAAANDEGIALMGHGHPVAALRKFEECRKIVENSLARDPLDHKSLRDLEICRGNAGRALLDQEKLGDALIEFGATKTTIERLLGLRPNCIECVSDLASVHNNIGNVLRSQGKAELAIKAFTRGQELRRVLVAREPKNPNFQIALGIGYANLGEEYRRQDRQREARAALDEALAIAKSVVLNDPANAAAQARLALSYGAWGTLMAEQNLLDDARSAFESERTLMERLVKQDTANNEWQYYLASSYDNSGTIWSRKHNVPEAVSSFKAAVRLLAPICAFEPSNRHWQGALAATQCHLGSAYAAEGQTGDALQAFQASKSSFEKLVHLEPTNVEWNQELADVQSRVRELTGRTE